MVGFPRKFMPLGRIVAPRTIIDARRKIKAMITIMPCVSMFFSVKIEKLLKEVKSGTI
jgi:hypothetical protein